MNYERAQGNRLFQLLLVMIMSLMAQAGMADERYVLQFNDNGGKTDELTLPIGKSQIIYSRSPLDQVLIGNPEIADIKLLSSRHVLILGIKPGHTNLVFRDKNKSLVALMDVIVGYDMDQLKRKLYEVMPGEKNLQIRGSNDKVILSGQISSQAAMERALSIARSFVPKDKVVNMLEVGGGNQVMLQVRIAEVSRTSLKELGVNLSLLDRDGSKTLQTITGITPNNVPFLNSVFNAPNSTLFGFNGIGMQLQALQREGLAKILAKPNLTAQSGQEASFLAGGEVAIPVAQNSGTNGNTTISVQFKEFGVGLKFTPTVLSDDHINIKLNAEVSSIDPSNGFQASGFNIPGFITRRTGTTVEMADGQAFAIAGLIQNNMNNVVNKVPALGSIPVLGALFRSTEFKRNETELVVVVTPRLVKPGNGDKVAMPTDVVIPPSDVDQYLMGFLEHYPTGKREKDGKAQQKQLGVGEQGGLQGSYGHQIREVNSHE